MAETENTMSTAPPTFATTVRRLREDAGLNLTAMAHESQIWQGTLSKWENGRRAPRLGSVLRFARTVADRTGRDARDVLLEVVESAD